MYYWDLNWIGMMLFDRKVSVVVRRMYYWDRLGRFLMMKTEEFQ